MASEELPVPSTEETAGNMMSEVLRQEDEFLEYLMSLPRNEPARPSVPTEHNDTESKVGLDHLDNLCKLMEQLGELREQNFKLQRRVQYLEDLRAIQDMHRQLKARVHRQSSEESIQGKVQKKTRDSEESLHNEETNDFHERARSRSVGPDELPIPPIKAKVSKWTRVKEAFRWEKAQLEPTPVSAGPHLLPEAKSQDSGIGLGQDRSLLLQVPPRNVDSSSPADSVLSYSAPMSSSSSSEELMDIDLDFAALSEVTDFATGPQRSASASAHTNGERAAQLQLQQSRRRSLSPGGEDQDAARRSKSLESGHEDNCKLMLDKKASKTPWGKVKNIIQTRRDSLKRRGPPRPGCSDDEGEDEPPRRSREPSGDKRHPPMLTITLPSTEELHAKPPQSPQALLRAARRSDPHSNRVKDIYRRQSSLPRPAGALVGTSPPPHRRPSKWTKVKKAFLTSRRDEEAAASAVSMPCSPHRSSASAFQFEQGGTAALQAEVQRNYEELQSRLTLEFHKKLGEWEQRKSREVVADESVEFRKKLHEWEKIKAKEEEVQPPPAPPPPPPMPPPPPVHYQLSPQFRKRLLEWQIRRAVAGKAGPHEEHELHKELPEDFTRKLQEWEKIKAGKTSPRLARKDSRNESACRENEKSKVAHKDKQLQWLEKELNKVEREKRRLEREREKFLEREARLERMRRAMHTPAVDSSGEQEVLIQTSTGFFRFHGISEQFTRRLYEWEQQRGIAPEASTFALLDPKFRPEAGEDGTGAGAGGSPGGLVRSKSVGSVADMAGITAEPSAAELVQSQPSSLSLNDVEALEAELEESRVSSEPRLRSDSVSRARADSRSVQRSRSNSRSAPRRGVPPPPPLQPLPLLESPGAVIVDVDEVEEAASLLHVIPAVRAETPVYSVASPEVTSLAQATSGSDDPGISPAARVATEGTSVQRGDSVRSVSSYQLLEENMQLLSELKHKEAVCRQLEAEMEQLERKLQDVAATQHRQIERLRQEETDRTDDEEQQPPSEERVARLRRSVMELGARRERLQRQGQQLQDSFAEAWQAQAALAQSLVGRARLLKRGVAGEQTSSGSQSPSPGSSRVAIASSASAVCPVAVSSVPLPAVCVAAETIQFQDPVVAKVEDLSTQLLALAEKLEHALTSRTREIQTLRSELLRGPGGGSARLRPPSGTESQLSSSLNSLQTRDAEGPNMSAAVDKHFLPRQSSEELAELPQLLTGKVLELKRGLSELCAAAHTREPEANTDEYKPEAEASNTDQQQDDEIDEAETTATFVLRVGGWKRGPSESSSTTPLVSSTSANQESSSSPVASVTIRPPFWRRVAVEEPSSCSDSEPGDEGDKSESDDNVAMSPKKPPEEDTASLKRSRSSMQQVEENVSRSQTSISKVDAKEEGNNGRRCSLRRMSKLISEETRDAWRQHQYVTTVSATATTPEAKKLKTRRVSDTHVAYKSQESKNIEVANPEPSSPINVFVPTTRKIFSPVQGKTDETIIGYVISDSSSNIPEKTVETTRSIPWRRLSSTEAENSTTKSANCVAPWRRTRDSQSASPAMSRKMLPVSFSPESSPRARRLHVDGKNEASPLPPPFPRSPTPNRRAEQKNNKEASSSIKQMIAKYNQKLAEQPSSPVPISPSYSPAWRSPVAERRDLSGMVRTQMEKYQEEVRRALQQGFSSSRRPTEVQKSASAGAIRCPSATTIPQQREPPPLLKSSSAGAIKSPLLPLKRIPDIKISNDEKLESEPSSPLDQSIDMTIQAYRKNTAPSRHVSSKTPHSPCMRALKIRRAKEEFLSRGPGALNTGEAGCRLSQASAGSGSSFEDLLLDNEGIVKSASAGMIHVQAEVYKRLTEPENKEEKPATSKPETKSKFGLSSLASKFRKVRLRKREKLNTVSMLCRQSLLVDLDDSRRQEQGSSQDQQNMATLKPSTSTGKESVSCPNSPVLEHKTIWIKRHKREK